MNARSGQPKVSVCLITFNHERYLGGAIDGVLSQELDGELELVIGEDCSTDGTRAVAENYAHRYPGKVRVLARPKNIGLMRNLHETLVECRGEYVALLEGDDYWTDGTKLRQQVAFLDANPQYSISFHQTVLTREDKSAPPQIWPVLDRTIFSVEDLLRRQFIPTSATVFRRSAFPGFPEWYLEIRIFDWLLHILLAQHGKIGFIPRPMSRYRIHGSNVWVGQPWRVHLEIYQEMFDRLHRFVDEPHRSIVRKTRFDQCIWLGRECVAQGDRSAARASAFKLWSMVPIGERLRDKLSLSLQAATPRLFEFQQGLRRRLRGQTRRSNS